MSVFSITMGNMFAKGQKIHYHPRQNKLVARWRDVNRIADFVVCAVDGMRRRFIEL